MKNRIAAVMLSSALICAVSTGCAGGSSPEDKSIATGASSTAETVETTGISVTSQTETSAESSTAAEAEKEFNFEDAVRSISICGQEINYPITLADLGDDFTIDTDFNETWFDDFMCTISYKGKHIGVVTYNDVDSPGKIDENTYMAGIYIATKYYSDFDVPLITVNGIGLGGSRDKVIEEFGESPLGMETQDYYHEIRGMLRELSFDYSYPDYDTVSGIDIVWN